MKTDDLGILPPVSNEGQRFISLEGLRAYMAWWVVAMHLLSLCGCKQLLPTVISNFILSGGAAVKVFMIVSGFVIAHLMITKPERYAVYLRRRAYRILPIYFFCIALAIPLASAQLAAHGAPWVDQATRWQAGFAEQDHHFWTHFVLHLTLLHGLVPDTLLPFASWTMLGPAWSLSLEWQFYIIAPLILFYIKKSRIAGSVTVLALIILIALSQSGLVGTWQFPSMVILGMPFFLIGIFSRILFYRISSVHIWWTIGGGLAAAYIIRDLRLVLCIWTFFMLAMRVESEHNGNMIIKAIQWISINRFIVFLGKASYSTYLIHILLLSFIAQILSLVYGELTLAIARQSAIITLILLPGISLFLYRCVEKPFIRFGSKKEAQLARMDATAFGKSV